MVTRFAAALLCALCLPAQAAVVTVGFENLPHIGHNFERDGFRFSPRCHQHVVPRGGIAALGWDSAECRIDENGDPYPDEFGPNPDYLGSDKTTTPIIINSLYIDAGGRPFSLLSVDLLGDDANPIAGFVSSNGALYRTPTDLINWFGYTTVQFSGPDWADLEWIIISNGGGHPLFWMGAITFQVLPEPSSLWLALAGCLALCHFRRAR